MLTPPVINPLSQFFILLKSIAQTIIRQCITTKEVSCHLSLRKHRSPSSKLIGGAVASTVIYLNLKEKDIQYITVYEQPPDSVL